MLQPRCLQGLNLNLCLKAIGASLPAHGAGTRSRTRDLLITNQLLYQLSYAGISVVLLRFRAGLRIIRHSKPNDKCGGLSRSRTGRLLP
jgi:hypothetical protein